jgi:mono/diheme cytochrome c family protein
MSRMRIIGAALRRGAAPLSAVALTAVAFAATTVSGQPKAAASPPSADPALIARGRYMTAASDCVDCHTAKGGTPFAGGRPLQTPFGTILSANLTPDKTGIGGWTEPQFYRALHTGVDDEGKHLYPAFPYNYYTRLTRSDTDAIFAYLQTLKPVANRLDRNRLPFPFNIRGLMSVWDALFLKAGEFKPRTDKSADWNRGAYLVQGPGHCGACHTPMNLFGAPRDSQFLHGGKLGAFFAPDLTANPRTGLGGWTRTELIDFLKTGGNAHTAAANEMGEVVSYSTSQMSDQDLNAIATYLEDLPPSRETNPGYVDKARMSHGAAIFADTCSACHGLQGEGTPRFFPPLRGDANLQQSDPTTTLNLILNGVHATPTASRPTGLSMPAYAWKLDDRDVAAVATYVRNAWGNHAPAVGAWQVAGLRRQSVARGSQTAAVERSGALARPTPSTLAPADTDSRDNGGPNAGRPAKGQGAGGGAGPNAPASPSTAGPG